MNRSFKVISADGHLEVPKEAWIKYMPEELRSRTPQLLRLRDGTEAWLVEGHPLIPIGPSLAGGVPQNGKPITYFDPEGRPAPGTGDARQRLREQDEDGIDAEVLFPPILTGHAVQSIADKDVYRAIVRAYNTFLIRDYCPVAPDRLIACGVIPTTGIADALAELQLCKDGGLKAVALTEFPAGNKFPVPEDDPFWERALAIGMPVTAHTYIGTRFPPFITQGNVGSLVMQQTKVAAAAGILTTRQVGFAPTYSVAQLIASGVFDRFPELQLYFAETNGTWLLGALWQMDDNYKTFEFRYPGPKLKKLPTEYFKQHVYCGFVRDPLLGRLSGMMPVENFMFGSDFPHGVTSYLSTRRWLDETFEGSPPGLRERILVENPARFFHLDLEKAITPTPA